MSLISYLLGDISYALLDSGLANILGLETLNHGTNLINYLNIRLYGGDPKNNGKRTGSTEYQDGCEKFFYVFKDSELKPSIKYKKNIIENYINIKKIGPQVHKTISTINLANSFFNSKTFVFFTSVAMFAITPTLHFRFSKIEKNLFEDDPNYSSAAYRTKKVLESSRIGLFGTIKYGFNKDWINRVREKPFKIITGVIQIICFVALTRLSINRFYTNPCSAFLGALLS